MIDILHTQILKELVDSDLSTDWGPLFIHSLAERPKIESCGAK